MSFLDFSSGAGKGSFDLVFLVLKVLTLALTLMALTVILDIEWNKCLQMMCDF